MAKALIDWRKLLKEAVKLDVDWSYRNAFIEEGVVNANLEEMPYPETEIVLDTSGSVNEILLKKSNSRLGLFALFSSDGLRNFVYSRPCWT